MATDDVTGVVNRLFPGSQGCRIRLHNQTPPDKPKDDYYLLEIAHKNYAAMYALALVAAVNRLPLRINTVENIDPSVDSPLIQYLVVEWL
jgi:hypothetical protein